MKDLLKNAGLEDICEAVSAAASRERQENFILPPLMKTTVQ